MRRPGIGLDWFLRQAKGSKEKVSQKRTEGSKDGAIQEVITRSFSWSWYLGDEKMDRLEERLK